jgi:secreted trypsin-like serine protease
MYDGKKKKWLLGGITNWGYECVIKYYPGVYTRVSSYVKWIDLIESDRNNRFTVSVSGGGSVTSNPEGINCDRLCNSKFSKNKEVVVVPQTSGRSSWGGRARMLGHQHSVLVPLSRLILGYFFLRAPVSSN